MAKGKVSDGLRRYREHQMVSISNLSDLNPGLTANLNLKNFLSSSGERCLYAERYPEGRATAVFENADAVRYIIEAMDNNTFENAFMKVERYNGTGYHRLDDNDSDSFLSVNETVKVAANNAYNLLFPSGDSRTVLILPDDPLTSTTPSTSARTPLRKTTQQMQEEEDDYEDGFGESFFVLDSTMALHAGPPQRDAHSIFLQNYKIFNTVRGIARVGLLVDPGASKGLIGYETLRRIIDEVLKPAGLADQVKWSKSQARFTGISSKVEKSMGIVTFPIGLVNLSNAVYRADVISGGCPGLVPLSTLIRMEAVMACCYYSNGDGLLLLREPRRKPAPQRLLLTDSGHYLLQIHLFGSKASDQQHKASSNVESMVRQARPTQHEPKPRTQLAASQVYPIASLDSSSTSFRTDIQPRPEEAQLFQ